MVTAIAWAPVAALGGGVKVGRNEDYVRGRIIYQKHCRVDGFEVATVASMGL